MKRFGSIVMITALTAVGCGGSDSGGDEVGAGSADGDDFCAVLADLADDLVAEDFEATTDAYRRIADAAPDDLADDLELAVESFEKIGEWAEDPTSEYPFSEDEDIAIQEALERIDARATEECGVVVGEVADDEIDEAEATAATDDAVDEAVDDDGDDIIASDGESTLGGDLGGDLPEDFPFPRPDTYEVGSQFWFEDESGVTYTAVLHAPADDFDAIAELYQAYLDGEGFEVTTTEFGTESDRMVWLGGERDDVRADVTMSIEEIGNDADGNLTLETNISLGWIPTG